MHIRSPIPVVIFPSGLYCFTVWKAVPKYPSQMSVFHSLNTFTRETLPHRAIARQEKEDQSNLTEMEDEGHLPPTYFFFFFSFSYSNLPHPKMKQFFVVLCFQLQRTLYDSAPTLFRKSVPSEGYQL